MACVWLIAGSSLSGQEDDHIVNSGALDQGPIAGSSLSGNEGWGYQCQNLKKQNSLYCWAHRSDDCRPQGIYTQIPPAHKFAESPALLCSSCPILPLQRKKPRRPAEKQEEHSTAEPASNAKGLFNLYYSMVVKSENLDDPLFEQLKSFVQFAAMPQTKQQEKQMAFMSTPLGETIDGSIIAIMFL